MSHEGSATLASCGGTHGSGIACSVILWLLATAWMGLLPAKAITWTCKPACRTRQIFGWSTAERQDSRLCDALQRHSSLPPHHRALLSGKRPVFDALFGGFAIILKAQDMTGRKKTCSPVVTGRLCGSAFLDSFQNRPARLPMPFLFEAAFLRSVLSN